MRVCVGGWGHKCSVSRKGRVMIFLAADWGELGVWKNYTW